MKETSNRPGENVCKLCIWERTCIQNTKITLKTQQCENEQHNKEVGKIFEYKFH